MKTWLLLITAGLGLSACTPKVVSYLPYYKLPVVQGKQLDAESILALREGMTRQEVELYVGKPLLRPSFRDTQWDYNYEVMRGGKVTEQRDLTVYFNGDVVSKISGSAINYAREQIQQKTIQQQAQERN